MGSNCSTRAVDDLAHGRAALGVRVEHAGRRLARRSTRPRPRGGDPRRPVRMHRRPERRDALGDRPRVRAERDLGRGGDLDGDGSDEFVTGLPDGRLVCLGETRRAAARSDGRWRSTWRRQPDRRRSRRRRRRGTGGRHGGRRRSLAAQASTDGPRPAALPHRRRGRGDPDGSRPSGTDPPECRREWGRGLGPADADPVDRSGADDPEYENLYDRFYAMTERRGDRRALAFAALLTGRGDLVEEARRRLVGLARAGRPSVRSPRTTARPTRSAACSRASPLAGTWSARGSPPPIDGWSEPRSSTSSEATGTAGTPGRSVPIRRRTRTTRISSGRRSGWLPWRCATRPPRPEPGWTPRSRSSGATSCRTGSPRTVRRSRGHRSGRPPCSTASCSSIPCDASRASISRPRHTDRFPPDVSVAAIAGPRRHRLEPRPRASCSSPTMHNWGTTRLPWWRLPGCIARRTCRRLPRGTRGSADCTNPATQCPRASSCASASGLRPRLVRPLRARTAGRRSAGVRIPFGSARHTCAPGGTWAASSWASRTGVSRCTPAAARSSSTSPRAGPRPRRLDRGRHRDLALGPARPRPQARAVGGPSRGCRRDRGRRRRRPTLRVELDPDGRLRIERNDGAARSWWAAPGARHDGSRWEWRRAGTTTLEVVEGRRWCAGRRAAMPPTAASGTASSASRRPVTRGAR